MSRLFKAYESILHRYPNLSQSIQTGILVGVGDVISQTVVEKHGLKNYDFVRTAQYVSIGTLYIGPALTFWYRFLEKHVGTSGNFFALKKMALDQLCFSPICLSGFIVCVNTVQGKTFEEVKTAFKQQYPEILLANYKLWPAVQLVNFYFVPLRYQVLFVQGFALFWNTYICYKTKPNKPE